MTKRDAQRAARRGARFLDERLGRGWRRRIRKRDLDMGAGSYTVGACGCILAQLDARERGSDQGSFALEAHRLGLNEENSYDLDYEEIARLGFLVVGEADVYAAYDRLTDAWLEELRTR